jgi:CheY-like chemotaxis protein
MILDQQLDDLQQHVNGRLGNRCFSIEISDESRSFLLEKGTSSEYGARELKRSIHRYLIQPLATLVIENTLQAGSTVRVLLNEAKDGLTFESVRGVKSAVVSPPTVLIVDDNRDFLRLLALDLGQAAQWVVTTAQSVVEAEHASSIVPLDFALLDFILPDGTGLELGAKLKKRWPAIHVAIMTGGELSANEEYECGKFGFDIINKPFLPQQIVGLFQERGIKKISRVSA